MRRLLACLLMTALLPGLAGAQDLSPLEAKTQARYQASDLAFDRSDRHCEGRLPEARCRVPGTPLAGGGEGLCVREIDADREHINLRCKVIPGPDIRRDIPDGPFVAPSLVCTEREQWLCETPPPTPDRFCAGKAPGAACTAEYTLHGEKRSEAGVCTPGEATEQAYLMGAWTLRRPLLTCEAAAPVPPPEWRPLTWWQRLWQ